MTYWIIGLIIGIVMGLTGAGGALIAIPLFMHFLFMNLKESSVYSLMAVFLASLLNFIDQRKLTQFAVALPITLCSFFGSLISAPYKQLIPNDAIVLLLILISTYSLYGIWSKPFVDQNSDASRNRQFSHNKKSLFTSVILGILLGILTTFSGIGGGVLLVPVFLKIYGLPQQQAVATGLFAVGLSSIFSLFIQVKNGFHFVIDREMGLLILGILVAVILLKLLVKKLSVQKIEWLRKMIFTLVVIFAMIKIII